MSVLRVLGAIIVFAGVAFGVRMLAELPRVIQQATSQEGRLCRGRYLARFGSGGTELAEPPLRETGPLGTEYQALQGTWDVVRMISGGSEMAREGAQVRFTDRSMTLIQNGNLPTRRMLTLGFTLLSAGETGTLDFVPQAAGGRDSPPLPGIYRITDNGLLLCVSQGDPSRMRRPVAFESREGSSDLLLVLQRGR